MRTSIGTSSDLRLIVIVSRAIHKIVIRLSRAAPPWRLQRASAQGIPAAKSRECELRHIHVRLHVLSNSRMRASTKPAESSTSFSTKYPYC